MTKFLSDHIYNINFSFRIPYCKKIRAKWYFSSYPQIGQNKAPIEVMFCCKTYGF